MLRFMDRRDAGRQLARRLGQFRGQTDVLVVGLPRGGIPVAYEVARAIRAPLDVLVVRKIGAPGNEEFGVGAIASGGVEIVDELLVRRMGIPQQELQRVMARERNELERREAVYRRSRPFPDVRGCTVLIIDDGLATGTTMAAAVHALRKLGAREIIAAAPVGAPDVISRLRAIADDCICYAVQFPMRSVGEWYEDFSQTTDEEVLALTGSYPQSRDASSASSPVVPEARW